MKLSDSKIIITGGASGLGYAMAVNLSVVAGKVIVLDKNETALKSLQAECPSINCYSVDLTNFEQVTLLITEIFKEFGKINVLINNAGIIHSELLVNILNKEDAKHNLLNWQRTIDINLNAVFYVTVNVAEKMVKSRSKGVIINISSISSSGNVGQSAYSATKAALNALSVTWAKELGMFGIRSVAIAPGFIDTPSTQTALNESKVMEYKNATPLRRLGKIDEIVHSIIYTIENDFFNGTVLNLDGGLKI